MPTDGDWWLSTVRMTFWAKVEGGRIVQSAPIARKFIGQPAANLIRWLEKQGGLLTHKY